MLTPSEEVTKTWIAKKGILVKNRPEPSRFSFVVCLTIVFSIAFGFLSGFITAGFALNENYSSVYDNLLAELENSRRYIEREKEKLETNKAQGLEPLATQINHANMRNRPNKTVHDQAIFGTFSHAIELLQKNNKAQGCKELHNIIGINGYSGKWKTKARYLLDKNCKS